MTPTCRFGLLFGLTFTALAPLHAQAPAEPTAPLLTPLKSAPHSVICGTTIFSGSATADPRIAKPVPQGNFTMHVVQPRACRDNNATAANTSRFPVGKPLDVNRLPTFLGPKR